ncbi:MAG: tol-pal system-associated acyl-CoA thioesterase [Pseudomonadota bacterium]
MTHHRDAHAAFIWPVRVYYEDTDAAGVVYYANYLKFFERARTEWLRALGFDQAELAQQQGIVFVVRAVSTHYHSPAQLDDVLQVESVVTELGRSRMVFTQKIKRGHATLVSATVEVACVDSATFKPVAMPHAVREKMSAVLIKEE